MKKENAWESLQQFANEHYCDMVVLMGMKTTDTVRRDLGLIILKETKLTKDLKNVITVDNFDLLELELKFEERKCFFYEQHNIKASRKKILPILQDILNKN